VLESVTVMRRSAERKKVHEVFGVSPSVLPDSYVDRGELDEGLRRLLERPNHVALRGVSKCGKSWLRQSVLPEAVIVQCRLGKTVIDVYTEALAELGVRLEVESVAGSSLRGRVEGTTEVGNALLARLSATASVERETDTTDTTRPVGNDVNDLGFIADIIKTSGQRLVIEDFHYLSIAERQSFAFDLKALWDYGVPVVIVGVWSKQNMVLFLNPDLSGRVEEVPIVWRSSDLDEIFRKGGTALGITFGDELKTRAIEDCFENAGVLQRLIIGTLDELASPRNTTRPSSCLTSMPSKRRR
jgi:hypothetical protein